MHDVAREFRTQQGCAETIGANAVVNFFLSGKRGKLKRKIRHQRQARENN